MGRQKRWGGSSNNSNRHGIMGGVVDFFDFHPLFYLRRFLLGRGRHCRDGDASGLKYLKVSEDAPSAGKQHDAFTRGQMQSEIKHNDGKIGMHGEQGDLSYLPKKLTRTLSIHRLDCNDYVIASGDDESHEHSEATNHLSDQSNMADFQVNNPRGKNNEVNENIPEHLGALCRHDDGDLKANQAEVHFGPLEMYNAGKEIFRKILRDEDHISESIVDGNLSSGSKSSASASFNNLKTPGMNEVDKDTKKEKYRISMDSVLHKLPYGQKASENMMVEKFGISGRNKPNLKKSRSLMESIDRYSLLLDSSTFKKEFNNNGVLRKSKSVREAGPFPAMNRSKTLGHDSSHEFDPYLSRKDGLYDRSNVIYSWKPSKLKYKITDPVNQMVIPHPLDVIDTETNTFDKITDPANEIVIPHQEDTLDVVNTEKERETSGIVDDQGSTSENDVNQMVIPHPLDVIDTKKELETSTFDKITDPANEIFIPHQEDTLDVVNTEKEHETRGIVDDQGSTSENDVQCHTGNHVEEAGILSDEFFEEIGHSSHGQEIGYGCSRSNENPLPRIYDKLGMQEDFNGVKIHLPPEENAELVPEYLTREEPTPSMDPASQNVNKILHHNNFSYDARHVQIDWKDEAEFNYVRELLDKSGFSGNELSEAWSSAEQPVDFSLFEEVEGSKCRIDFGLYAPNINLDHLLLYDLINEVLLETYSSDMNPWLSCFSSDIHRTVIGSRILHEVWTKVHWHRSYHPEVNPSVNHVMDRDLSRNDGWLDVRNQIEQMGQELEALILNDLLDEVAML